MARLTPGCINPPFTLCLLTCLSYPLRGAELLSEQDYFDTLPTVLNATRMKQPITHSPASVTIIDREMLEASAVIELADLFRLVPGYQSHYINGSFWGVQPHGMGDKNARRLEVKVNGRSVYLPDMSTMDWVTIGVELEDIERIEIVRGPNTPTDGSNAFLGTINILTREPLSESGSQLRSLIGFNGKQMNYYKYNGQAPGLDYRLSLSHREDPGFSGVDDQGHTTHVNLQSSYTPNLIDQINVFAGYNFGDTSLGDGDHPHEFADRGVDYAYLHGQWKRQQGAADGWELNTYYNFMHQNDHRFSLINGYLLTAADFDATSERFDVDFQQHRTWSDQLKGIWAAGVRFDRLSSEYLLNQDHSTEDNWMLRLQGNLEWMPATDWAVNAGLMLEHNRNDNRLNASPRLAINYLLDTTQALRVAATRAYRQPSILEQYLELGLRLPDGTMAQYQDMSLGHLRPERMDSFEIGYNGRIPAAHLEIDLRLYYEDVDDAIGRVVRKNIPDAERGPRVNLFENSTYWHSRGLEIQAKYRPVPAALLSAQYGYTELVGKRLRKTWKTDPWDNLDDSAPEHTLSLLASYQFTPDWQASVIGYYTSYVYWLEGAEIEPLRRLDAQIKRHFKWNKLQGDLSLIGHNLTNEDNLEFQSSQYYDRRGFVRLNLQF